MCKQNNMSGKLFGNLNNNELNLMLVEWYSNSSSFYKWLVMTISLKKSSTRQFELCHIFAYMIPCTRSHNYHGIIGLNKTIIWTHLKY